MIPSFCKRRPQHARPIIFSHGQRSRSFCGGCSRSSRPATDNPGFDSGATTARDLSRPSTPLASKRRMGDEACPDPGTSPGPKRLAQHQAASKLLRRQNTTTTTSFVQKTSDQEFFSQIGETIGDFVSMITALTQWCGQLSRTLKSDATSADEHIVQNAALADDIDSRIKQGLSLLETQVQVLTFRTLSPALPNKPLFRQPQTAPRRPTFPSCRRCAPSSRSSATAARNTSVLKRYGLAATKSCRALRPW